MAVTGKNIGEGGNYSGTYVPTLALITNVSNVDTTGALKYRVDGNHVSVFGDLVIDAIAAGAVEVTLSLPIPTNMTSITDVAGSGVSIVSDAIHFRANTSSNIARALGNITDLAQRNYFFTFDYVVK